MNPDVVSTIACLRAKNVLCGEQAALFDRVAGRDLVSVRFEIQVLLWGAEINEEVLRAHPWPGASGFSPRLSYGLSSESLTRRPGA